MMTSKSFTAPMQAPRSDLLTLDQFASMYAAAEFAAHFDLLLDSHIIINWTALGLESQMTSSFQAFTKGSRDIMTKRGLASAWLYSHERSPKTGLHTHFALSLPYSSGHQRACIEWLRSWPVREVKRRVPGAIRLRVSKKGDPFLHWLLFHYLMKGYDPHEVVQSARYAPQGREIMLGDLIAFRWRDPGIVGVRKRVGYSQSLGPKEQAAGLPGASTFNRSASPTIRLTTDTQSVRLPSRFNRFRSTFADGQWDIRLLYGKEFCDRVKGKTLQKAWISAPGDNSLRPF